MDDSRNPQNLRMSPLSVYRERRADQLSRNIFFVAAARSIGIPARINEINGKLQYWDGDWQEAIMESREQRAESKEKDTSESNHISNPSSLISTLRLTFSPTRFIDNPKYYTHFTLSKIEDGRLQLLNYPEEATWQNTFDDGVTLDAGNYLLVTGTRLANGSVLANMQLFQLQPGRPHTMPLLMREDAAALQVIGSLNAENLYLPPTSRSNHFYLTKMTIYVRDFSAFNSYIDFFFSAIRSHPLFQIFVQRWLQNQYLHHIRV